MAIKFEPEDLESLMTRAMIAARENGPPPTSAQVGAGEAEVNAIAAVTPLKIANFWEDDPETWFMRLEMQFLTRKITNDESKFAHVVQTLDRKQTKEVKAIIRSPPKGAAYTTIKTALIRTFARTQLDKDTELLNMFTLGDRDPRSVIRELRALNENPETLLRAVVINMFPQDVRVELGSMAETATLEDIGEHAYKILDLRKDRKKGVHAIKRQVADSDSEEEVNAVMPKGGRTRGNRGDARRPRNGEGGKSQKEDGPFVCFAHKKFGPQAFSCKPGCSFAELPLAQRGAGNATAGR